MNKILKASALAAIGATLATAAPASAATAYSAQSISGQSTTFVAPGTETYNQYRDRNRGRYSRDDYRRGYRNDYRGRTWRGNDGRYYCQRSNGTTGLLIGGAAGALLGRELDGGRDRTLGTILGAGAGALLGREVDRGGSRCR